MGTYFLTAWSRRLSLLLVLLSLLFAVHRSASAALLDLELEADLLLASPGDTVTFRGRITNTTGVALSGMDLFFNFSGFDPDVFDDITQILGDYPLNLPDRTFSPIVDLFSLSLSPSVASGSYILDLTLQDVNGNLSDLLTPAVQVRDGTHSVSDLGWGFSAEILMGLALIRFVKGRLNP